jgi:hypothetical protein
MATAPRRAGADKGVRSTIDWLMDPAHAQAFRGTPWPPWSESAGPVSSARRGPAATLEVSRLLWEHLRRVRSDWPSDAERREDLSHHIALKSAIDRAARDLGPLAAR